MTLEHLANDSVFSRRDWLRYSALLGAAAAGVPTIDREAAAQEPGRAGSPPLARAPRRHEMKKSINLWAFPYPQHQSLGDCFSLAKRAGFDGVEVNFTLEGDISLQSSEKELAAIRSLADRAGIAISGLCSFLFWPYPLTANSEATRARALEIAGKMLETARLLGTTNVLVVPGAVGIPWIKDSEIVPYSLCDERARAAVHKLIPLAEKNSVTINIENIFFNGYLLSPRDMVEFVDSFKSDRVRVHFDTGNILSYQFPEHWIPVLGKRIQNVHLKEWTRKGTDFSLESFRPLLDGTTDWPLVVEAFDAVGYRGYLTFEYFHPFQHYPEALVFQASDALDRILGRA